MILYRIHVYILPVILAIIPLYINAQETGKTEEEVEIGIVEQLNKYIPEDIELTDINGNKVFIHEQINKPTILSMVYYRCPSICTPLMNAIADVMKKSDMNVGKDYQVITVSFNPRESYKLAARKKANYEKLLEDVEGVNEGWQFYTADSLNIARLTTSIGFRYKPTGNDFIHTATLIFISPEGKITRYLNGTQFLPFEYKMALIEASKGQPGPTINKILQYCYSYDPKGGQYVLNITRVAGTIIMFLLLSLFLILIIRPLTRKKT